MKARPALLSAIAAASLGRAAPDAASLEGRDDDVLITSVTDDPCCGSGILALAVGVSGRLAGAERSYFIPFMRPGQARPNAGDRCTIGWRWWKSESWHWSLAGGGRIWEGREVTDLRCRAG